MEDQLKLMNSLKDVAKVKQGEGLLPSLSPKEIILLALKGMSCRPASKGTIATSEGANSPTLPRAINTSIVVNEGTTRKPRGKGGKKTKKTRGGASPHQNS